jgi:hypothetical protein
MCAVFLDEPACSVFNLALDHIERLQARVQELEQERRWIHEDKTMIVKKDGDSWFAAMPDFKDLQQSEARWFNDTINQYMDAIYWYLNEEPKSPQEEE